MKQLTNNQLKFYSSLKQKKYRDREQKFLIEGWHLIEECVDSDFHIEMLIAEEDTFIKHKSKILNYSNKKNFYVSTVKASSFNKLSDTVNSQGVICAVQKKDFSKQNFSKSHAPVIALDEINDPGNLGTILRTAYWFNAGLVMISKNSADIYNPKVLRASQGAVFHLNILTGVDLSSELSVLKQQGFIIYLLNPHSKLTLENTIFEETSCFVFGNETRGINQELIAKGFKEISIKGYSDCESLNVATSIGIVLHFFRNKIAL